MLAAYYSRGCDSAALFAKRKIERNKSFEKHLNKYNVIFLNMQQFLIGALRQSVTEYLEQEVLEELHEEYGEVCSRTGISLADALRRIYAKTRQQFIILIDEWDCVMRERQESETLQRQYLDFLRNLLKDQPFVALVYVTGILPVKKYGQHSALNMFWEYSMTDQFDFEEYTGFTEEEVKALCVRLNGFDQVSDWYDGYCLQRFRHIYNPRSVVGAIRNGVLSDYWTSTETYEALKVYIGMNFDGLREEVIKMLGGGHCKIDPSTFQNDMTTFQIKDDVLTLLVHLGYLTYDKKMKP